MFKSVDEIKIQKLFKLQKNNKDVFFVIWTTTPWTLPANQAIAVGDKINYVLLDLKDKLIIIAKDLKETLIKKIKILDYNQIGECVGADLIGLKARHPLYNKQVPVIAAEHVTTENGTGLVHIAPGHGQDDYIAGIKHNLEI